GAACAEDLCLRRHVCRGRPLLALPLAAVPVHRTRRRTAPPGQSRAPWVRCAAAVPDGGPRRPWRPPGGDGPVRGEPVGGWPPWIRELVRCLSPGSRAAGRVALRRTLRP